MSSRRRPGLRKLPLLGLMLRANAAGRAAHDAMAVSPEFAALWERSVAVHLHFRAPAPRGPGAAIDRYGRFVGDIVLPDGTNLNLSLLRNGLSVVVLYDSMLPHEIQESVQAWQQGRKVKKSGIARFYSKRFFKFENAV